MSAAIVGLLKCNHRRKTVVAAATTVSDTASPAALDHTRRPVISVPEMEWDAGDDGVRLEEQRALDQECALVVKKMMPPFRGDELGQHDGDVVVRMLLRHLADVLEQRLH